MVPIFIKKESVFYTNNAIFYLLLAKNRVLVSTPIQSLKFIVDRRLEPIPMQFRSYH